VVCDVSVRQSIGQEGERRKGRNRGLPHTRTNQTAIIAGKNSANPENHPESSPHPKKGLVKGKELSRAKEAQAPVCYERNKR